MTRRVKPKRNKAYRPRPASRVGGLFVFGDMYAAAEDAQPISGDALTDLGVAYHQAMHSMVGGASSEQDWCTVVCALNIGLVLTERGFGAECESAFVDALDGAFRARIRANKTGQWRFDGEALRCINAAFYVHDQQVQLATKEEMRNALLEVRRRIDQGNVYREALPEGPRP